MRATSIRRCAHGWCGVHAGTCTLFRPIQLANQVERFFGIIIIDKAIRRDSFNSVKELTKKIDSFVSQYNKNYKPFTWTATADSNPRETGPALGRITGREH